MEAPSAVEDANKSKEALAQKIVLHLCKRGVTTNYTINHLRVIILEALQKGAL